WRSMTMSPPRAVARDSRSVSFPSATIGESCGKLMLMDLCGSKRVSWEKTSEAPARAKPASIPPESLLDVDIIDRHVACLGIHVASPHGAAGGLIIHIAPTRVQQHHRLVAF